MAFPSFNNHQRSKIRRTSCEDTKILTAVFNREAHVGASEILDYVSTLSQLQDIGWFVVRKEQRNSCERQ